jgi:hypothetical protein
MSGLYATNQRARLGIARGVLDAGREPSNASSDTNDQDSLEAEFSGDREGQSTYRVRCQKCVDQPPMQREDRLTGRDTMRCLAFIIAMQMYFSSKQSPYPVGHPHPGELVAPGHSFVIRPWLHPRIPCFRRPPTAGGGNRGGAVGDRNRACSTLVTVEFARPPNPAGLPSGSFGFLLHSEMA